MNKAFLTLTMASCLALGSCSGTISDRVGSSPSHTKTVANFLSPNAKTTNDRLETVAKQALRDGSPEEALKFYEDAYKNASNDPDNALNYAQVLRKTGNPDRAVMVLAPHAKEMENSLKAHQKNSRKKLKYDPMLMLEYASSNIESGHFERAEGTLQNILLVKDTEYLHPQVLNLIGVSMDARAMHQAAEPYYRDAMDIWQGEATTVMNNLALNLAHQGYFDESLTLLRQAHIMAPDKSRLSANIDLVTELQGALIPKARMPSK